MRYHPKPHARSSGNAIFWKTARTYLTSQNKPLSSVKIPIQGVPGLKVHINIFEFLKKME